MAKKTSALERIRAAEALSEPQPKRPRPAVVLQTDRGYIPVPEGYTVERVTAILLECGHVLK